MAGRSHAEEKSLVTIVFINTIPQHLYFWRRLCDRDADEEKVRG